MSEENMANQLEEMARQLKGMAEKLRFLAEASPHNGDTYRIRNRAHVNKYTRDWARAAKAIKDACGKEIPLWIVRSALLDSNCLVGGSCIITRNKQDVRLDYTTEELQKAVTAYYETEDWKNRQVSKIEKALDSAISTTNTAVDAIKAREAGVNDN